MRLSGRSTGWTEAAPAMVGSRYVGGVACEYDRVRHGSKWKAEDQAVAELLKHVRKGSRTLDVPVGTGRFLALFEGRSLVAHGLDVSTDMLALAKAKAKDIGAKVRLRQGDIMSLPYENASFDLVVCIRFLNLVGRKDVERVFRELVRVSGDKLLVGIRYLAPVSELHRTGLAAIGARPLWLVRRLIRGSEVLIQDKAFLVELLRRFRVTVLHGRQVEKTWDGTNYVLLLLQKSGGYEETAGRRSEARLEE